MSKVKFRFKRDRLTKKLVEALTNELQWEPGSPMLVRIFLDGKYYFMNNIRYIQPGEIDDESPFETERVKETNKNEYSWASFHKDDEKTDTNLISKGGSDLLGYSKSVLIAERKQNEAPHPLFSKCDFIEIRIENAKVEVFAADNVEILRD